MAIKYFCDRCNTEMLESEYGAEYGVSSVSSPQYSTGDDVFCSSCVDEIDTGVSQILNAININRSQMESEQVQEMATLIQWLNTQMVNLHTNENYIFKPFPVQL